MKEVRIPRLDIIRFDGDFCDKTCPQLSERDWDYPCPGFCSHCELFEEDIFSMKIGDILYSEEIARCYKCIEAVQKLETTHLFDDDYPEMYK